MTVAITVREYVDDVWERTIVPTLERYLEIPNVSPAYDPGWEAAGHMDRAVDVLVAWCRVQPIAGLVVTVERLPGRTPLICCEIPAFAGSSPSGAGASAEQAGTVLLYGHLDKQPEMTGWRDGLGPWRPVREGDRLYGRGGADDGYAVFACLAAIAAAQAAGEPHARCVVLIEASEESSSPDLPAYVDALADRLGTPDLVVCLDSGAIDDQRLWVTTSLRGLAECVLTVRVLVEGVHSGAASGVVPSSFRLLRQLLDRIEDPTTGTVLVPAAHVEIPPDRLAEAAATAAEIDDPFGAEWCFAGATRPMGDGVTERLLARTWHPTISYVGADGMPPTARAGNVLRPFTSLKLSLRLPPTCDHAAALEAVVERLTEDPPAGATIEVTGAGSAPGWNAPAFAPWLAAALESASETAFGAPARTLGEGGSIPFMGMLGERFPDAQFVVTGALVPGSNAHGPNEFLDLAVARNVTVAVAMLLASHARRAPAHDRRDLH